MRRAEKSNYDTYDINARRIGSSTWLCFFRVEA